MREAWTKESLDHTCEVTYGERVIKKRDAGTLYPVYGGGGETFRIDRFNRENCTIVSRFGMSESCVRHISGQFFLNDSGLSVHPRDPARLLPRFLDYFLYASQDLIYSLGRGSAQRNLDVTAFRGIPISYPNKLSEQKRIVAILDEAFAGIDAAIANTEKNLANARELFDRELNSVFDHHGQEWPRKGLSDLGVIQTGSTPKTADKENYGKYIPFIKPGDFLGDGRLNYANHGLSERGVENARIIPKGAVLMVCIGATIGKVAYSENEVTTNQQINSLSPGEQASSKFIYYQMLSKRFQRSVLSAAGQTTLPIISKKKWSSLEVLIPPSVFEQNIVVERLDELDREVRRLLVIYDRKRATLRELKQSLLQKAFAGELTAERTETEAREATP